MIAGRMLLFFVLLLPIAEIAAFIAVAAAIGFAAAFVLIVSMSMAGALILRHAGGTHIAIARLRASFGKTRLVSLRADGIGVTTLIAGILLLVPGFISGFFGVLLLAWNLFAPARNRRRASVPGHNIVDLDPQDWRTIPEQNAPNR